MELANKKVLVVGLGTTGVSTARFAKNRGADVTVTDTADENDLAEAVADMHRHHIRTQLGGHVSKIFTETDLVVISPGVPHTIEPLELARQKGIPVLGEVELASRYITAPIVAVTGTNGKTTTTELVGEMLKQSGRSVFVGGNIGCPLIDAVERNKEVEVVVAEISSFQLDTIETFRPRVGVLLNIAEDHLDRYPDLQAYARSKARLFENQQPGDVAILNGSDALTMDVTKHIRSRKLVFIADGMESPQPSEGAVVTAKGIELRMPADRFDPEEKHIAMPVEGRPLTIENSQIGLFGKHNLDNAAAAALAALAAGGTWEGVQSTLREARPLAHRLEFVTTVGNVHYYNDSKATNVDAVARALECFDQPVILLMGGRNKNIAFHILADRIRQGVKHLVAFGESREEIKRAFSGLVSVSTATSMTEAVDNARGAAAAGDVVLLSPACASFDMYTSYAQRGDDFRDLVTSLNE